MALCWAVASELIQGYFTARTMDVWDGVADMMGASLAVWVAWEFARPCDFYDPKPTPSLWRMLNQSGLWIELGNEKPNKYKYWVLMSLPN